MEDVRSVQMNDEERNEFLGRGGTGVVSFDTSGDEPPYSLPISYGYDAETETFYFRLAFGPETGKDDVSMKTVLFRSSRTTTPKVVGGAS